MHSTRYEYEQARVASWLMVWLLQLNSDVTAIEGMSHSRVDFSALARERIAAAQAAIAAAEKSAMNAYKAGSFHADTPVAPWVASPVKVQSTFAERLLQHDAHLNSIKNILPVEPTSPRAYHTSAPTDSHVRSTDFNPVHLPPWSQPAQLPSFSNLQKSGAISELCDSV
jgi:hypothetical protein